MPSTAEPIEMKISACSASSATTVPVAPARTAPVSSVNSLRNGPKGGEPLMASSPATSSAALTGSRRARPVTSRVRFVPVPSQHVARDQEEQRLGERGAQHVQQRAVGRDPASPAPTARMPMCSTLE